MIGCLPQTTTLDQDAGYKKVLGYSGTNSKYVVIRDSEFSDNGIAVVPNTESIEPFQPSAAGMIEHNLIYWNNFDYYRKSSPVTTTSTGFDNDQYNFPVGAGVVLFGASGWKIKHNDIFGNFLWGAAAFSDPTNTTDKAEAGDDQFIGNRMGDAHNDANGTDFFNDGSGHGTCFSSKAR